MGKNLLQGALARTVAVLFSFSTLAAPAKLRVRGTPIQLPFQVRILIVEQKDTSRRIDITGEGLITDRGVSLGEDKLRCEYYSNPLRNFDTFSLSPFKKAPSYWQCYNSRFKRVIFEPLRLRAKNGLMHIGAASFRGMLELVPKHDNLLVINDLDVDDYLAGLVNKEIRSDYPTEAVKAQVIAARSYALATAADRRRNGNLFDMYATQADQVYDGAQSEDEHSIRLVRETEGQVLVHLERVLKAYYHSCNGGYTEIPENVWGAEDAELDHRAFKAVPSPVDAKVSLARWKVLISPKMGLAWNGIGELTDVRILSKTEGKRVKALSIVGADGSQIWTPGELKQHLGPNWIRSTYFTVTKDHMGRGWLLEGAGWGHGVGLSQMGAQMMAAAGKSYQEILGFYYPAAHVSNLNLKIGQPPMELPQVPQALLR